MRARFANVACLAFLLLAPEDPRYEAAVYVLCEGPLAAALFAWQCAWLGSSPNHIISVLIHQLPGLVLFCHRFLTPAGCRRPLQLLARMAAALAAGPRAYPWLKTAAAVGASGSCPPLDASASVAAGLGSVRSMSSALGHWQGRLAAAADIARGRVACQGAAASVAGVCVSEAAAMGGGVGGSVACYALPAPPWRCPSPAWLWLVVAPLGFYAAWQLLYFLVVQVAFRRLILSRNYDTSYRCLARRAQRADNGLNRLVRSGGVARRLIMYGLLQLLYSVVTGAFAALTYRWFWAASLWQVCVCVFGECVWRVSVAGG
ncbi:hypothetical protein GPECTOR_239g565 [Gonium pectorale]|uniref:Glycerophosphocholine acyltransferase 1 n=1 Tax=Gonium pectorale TaxID=33097 RepID=A0A150FXL8_GONPE|nr:hypothetical protein GPECTOR_239g565 [Gonium pectorale]|eukprot:KXZ41935.1 hypothetical protein GPECTOR_239g565 [Gonium pectorale]